MFKRILNVICLIFILSNINSVFADSSVLINVNKNNIPVGDLFKLTIDIETTSTGAVGLSQINGLDSFERVGQESSSQKAMINSEVFNKFQLILSLKAKKMGKFDLGPVDVQIGEEIISSEPLSLEIIKQTLKKSIKNDIKPIKNPNSIYYSFFFFQALVILLLFGLFLYLKFMKKDDESLEIKEIKENSTKNYKQELVKNLSHLINGSEIMTKSEFYENLNISFRRYFELLGFSNTETLTLKEIKKLNLNKELISLFEKSYINEFSDKKDTPRTRKALVNNLLEMIK